jgi:VIT1/CCC1 family predicted Fe2+/Mn2+ transporter
MKWLSWNNVALGSWLIVAPFTLGYRTVHAAAVNEVIVGLLLLTFGATLATVQPQPVRVR